MRLRSGLAGDAHGGQELGVGLVLVLLVLHAVVAAVAGGAVPLVIVGVIASAITAFFYARVIVLMFFSDPAPDGPAVVRPSVFTSAAVSVVAPRPALT